MGTLRSRDQLQPGQHCIQIETDEYILLSDMTNRWQDATKIDFLIEPATPFWQALESSCVVECCGLSALSFLPESILAASAAMDLDELRKVLVTLLRYLRNSQVEVVSSNILNANIERKELLELIRHIAWYVDRPAA